MNESDARREDDLDRREAEVMCFRLRLKVSMVADVRIARGSEFQMTGAAERKERESKLVLDGVGTRNKSKFINNTFYVSRKNDLIHYDVQV